ncbi:hypothetical protein AC579_3861 [Pseudocercospora musae]|uniref:F-box domain-containing protein n=1 Tax=Pseudocercospora musae TaxID=113226 RepID=A0A139IS15_9PEZI|nr:hypothetical protein AC579_3861 [Pseudocercospora musae]
MAKRTRDDSGDISEDVLPAKRPKVTSSDRLSSLSDELLLKVLSFLPTTQLTVCERLSHKYRKLASDGQLWKSHYYDRFVRPRASRLPGLKDLESPNNSLQFASKASRWLEEDHLVRGGSRTNWKKQYKLRQNWVQGSAAVNEIPVAERESVPPVLVEMSNGIIYMADREDGLRAWTAKGARGMIAQKKFKRSSTSSPPTSLAVHSSNANNSLSRAIVGFEDGSFSVYVLDHQEQRFNHKYSHEPSSNGVLTATELRWPYAVTMTAMQLLSVYQFQESDPKTDVKDPPRLLHSMKSHTVLPPLSVSLRTTSAAIYVSIAYSMPTYLSGWTVGIQEVKIDLGGTLLNSRLASAIDQHYRPLAFANRPMVYHLPATNTGLHGGTTALELKHIHSKPTSLSYNHPYLLTSHRDNTLTLYLVTTTADSLYISPGARLWGHTSAVSGAHVGGRGKAVSISRQGDELRVWELEGGFTTSSARKRLHGDISVKVRPNNAAQETVQPYQSESLPKSGLDIVTHDNEGREEPELTISRGWIGFDDENVVVLKEHGQGKQALVVYDFT